MADDQRSRTAPAEHRWPVVIAVLIALALHLFLPSSLLEVQRYIVAVVVVALLIPLIVLNPHRLVRQTRWSRNLEIVTALVLVAANQITLVLLVFQLVERAGDGTALLVASLQVWTTNVIAFALLYWVIDRGGPVARVHVPREDLAHADFRFPQDEDHDAVVEVARGSSRTSDWVPSFVDYLYFSLSNSMAFSPTDTMPLTHRAKLLMGLESFAGFILLALVIARAVAQIG
ncbi:hypothetical protein [Agromyces atrinae]|uniref:Putative membrane protein n=1 Tax=Agromyces atrinae TaxID=592376 RepID=A0A4Q2M3L5_9MICO|nr:hypothetical protein [Agromyces atrinae]NYD66061.1 putative membrane protein [Agromyces atrinae]RXZ86388.1 hypothetical protein ESP50_11575 [Agromyces atrinae]